MRSQLRPLLTSWRGAFPHSVKEMTNEQAGGSLQSWLIALENRTGALACKTCVSKRGGETEKDRGREGRRKREREERERERERERESCSS